MFRSPLIGIPAMTERELRNRFRCVGALCYVVHRELFASVRVLLLGSSSLGEGSLKQKDDEKWQRQ
jgi:hypothetical protein